MARTLHRLSPIKVKTAKGTGMYADGGGLYLQVKATDNGTINKSWVFRYAIAETHENGRQKERQMGLGSSHTISLADAREKALKCRSCGIKELIRSKLDGPTMPTLRSKPPAL